MIQAFLGIDYQSLEQAADALGCAENDIFFEPRTADEHESGGAAITSLVDGASKSRSALYRLLEILKPPVGSLELAPNVDEPDIYLLKERALGAWVRVKNLDLRVYRSHGEGVTVDIYPSYQESGVETGESSGIQLWFDEAESALSELRKIAPPALSVPGVNDEGRCDHRGVASYILDAGGHGALSPSGDDPDTEDYVLNAGHTSFWIVAGCIDIHVYHDEHSLTVDLLPRDTSGQLGHAEDGRRSLCVPFEQVVNE